MNNDSWKQHGDHDSPNDICVWARIPFESAASSDWQIDVKFKTKNNLEPDRKDSDDNDATSYLVHECILGPKSEYFSSIFRANSFFPKCHQSRRSIFEFPADAPVTHHDFEYLLNFLYFGLAQTGEWSQDIVLAMLYWADYFGIESLRRHALIFCSRIAWSYDGKFIAKLYKLAEALSMKELQDHIASNCYWYPCIHFNHVWYFMRTPDLKRKLLYRMQRVRKNVEVRTPKWHQFVTHAIQSNPEIIDRDTFSLLTNKKTMRRSESVYPIFGADALAYLKHEHRLGLDERERCMLTYLQRLCTESLRDMLRGQWQPCFELEPQEVLEELSKLKPAIIDLLLL
jgi:hypothetical protein